MVDSILLLANIHNALATISPPLAPFVPFSIFGIIHAVRLACAYRQMTKSQGIDNQIGLIQAAAFPVILIFSGTTITSILMGTVPSWLISPLGLLNYALIPLLVAKTPVLPLVLAIPTLPREIFFALFDGFSRTVGATTFGVDTVLSHPNPALNSSPWAMVLISLIAGGGGGLVVPLLGVGKVEWGFNSTPGWIRDGPNVDIWGAALVGYVYATLIDAHPLFRILPSILFAQFPLLSSFVTLPKTYALNKIATPLLQPHEAKIACSLMLGGILCGRIMLPIFQQTFFPVDRRVKKISGKGKKVLTPSATPSKKTQ